MAKSGALTQTRWPSACVVGLGRIGHQVATALAGQGLQVLGVDHDPKRLAWCAAQGVYATGDLPRPTAATLLLTPSCDTKALAIAHLAQMGHLLAEVCPPGGLIVVESTTPPGAVRQGLVAQLERAGRTVGSDVFVAHVPERIAPGAGARSDLFGQPRVVGGATSRCAELAQSFYTQVLGCQVHLAQSLEQAELTKLFENAYRYVNVALANELASLGPYFGADAAGAMALANTHSRVALHQAGAGIGGHCLPYAAGHLAQAGAMPGGRRRSARNRQARGPVRRAAPSGCWRRRLWHYGDWPISPG